MAEGLTRRTLRFGSMLDALADADRIAACDAAGTLKRVGVWSTGQAFGHLASWMNYAFDGYPLVAPPELAARARARKDKALSEGLIVGFHIPGVPGGTAGTDDMPTAEALAKLHKAWARITGGMPTQEHPFFGALTHEEWIMLQLRHSELHQGFLIPGA
jgi:hypothetical protein